MPEIEVGYITAKMLVFWCTVTSAGTLVLGILAGYLLGKSVERKKHV